MKTLGLRVTFFHAFYNFARPHQSLRLPLPVEEVQGTGLFQHKWQACTPGMAAGLTGHVWSFRKLLTAKFEPIHNQSTSSLSERRIRNPFSWKFMRQLI